MTEADLFNGRPVIAFAGGGERRNFLKWASAIGVGSTLAAAAHARFASAQSDEGDIEILNYALTLEYLERDFFRRGLRSQLVEGRERELVEPVAAHEAEHVTILSSTISDLGGTPSEEPVLTYPRGTFEDRAQWLRTAATLQDIAVQAYHGQVTRITNVQLLGAAASIAGTESRHAAILAELSGRNPFPAPFERPKPKRVVLDRAQPFLAR
jgi:rubrerythrin